ncbi:hypothetical protein [Pseudomonas phage Astolliot]|nr:hypothetical protein [Pseudomonas phage Astolliot]
MKLSDALVTAINSGHYGTGYNQTAYMCNVLEYCDLSKHIPAVHDKISSFYPGAYPGFPLINVLSRLGICSLPMTRSRERFALCKEFYVWWIIQLRKEGL